MAYDLTLYYFLKRNQRVCYKTSLSDETRIRCPFCGDSKRDPNSAKLYIKNEAPFKFICFKCESSGVVNDNFLNSLKSSTGESSYEISAYMKQKRQETSIKGNFKSGKYNNLKYFRRELDFSITREKDLNKLKYLNNRLGTNITYNDVTKYKIILNIQDFFEKNEVDIVKRFVTDRDKKQFIQIRETYIGFLSSDRNVIVFRNTNPNCKDTERFANLRVYLLDETKKTYNIANKINIYKPNYNIIITEGIIDIIGVYEHFYKTNIDENNYIFLANCGKSYSSTLKYINSLSLLDNNITIYSDSDVNLELYKRLKNNSPEFSFNPITVLYNTLGKDYGVKKEEIQLSSKIIL